MPSENLNLFSYFVHALTGEISQLIFCVYKGKEVIFKEFFLINCYAFFKNILI